MENLYKRLKYCSVELGRWSAKHRKDANKEIEEKTTLLKEIQQREGPRDGVMIRQLDKEIAELLELDNIKWKQ